ncbi:hypothetical protein [Paucibacter sp. XJ19-41]|uniref:hypothetical protein n=1 Tax=Paucibacter sp. XJ19-41 TaxID=2927824 RepID=UPI00234A8925|nr:hypothetical protein [Paucibacter sp. XJ19-41]MDC6166119.1 hypothetical protein [Paucibacter sp. XJ19-41]
MQILIYGSRDFSLTVAELARHCGHEVLGKIDDSGSGDGVLGSFDQVCISHPPGRCGLVLAIGYKNLAARWRVWQQVLAAGYATPNLVHPRAYVADSAVLGPGCMVMAGALVDVRARIGAASVLWPGACISHDSELGSNCFISPNATLCGHVNLGADSFVGAGAAIADHQQLPPGSRLKLLERFPEPSR